MAIELTDDFVADFFKRIGESAGLDCDFSVLSTDGKYIAGYVDYKSLKDIHEDLQIAPAVVLELESNEFDENRIPEYSAIVKKTFQEKSQEVIDYKIGTDKMQ